MSRAADSELPIANCPNEFNHVRRLAGRFTDWPQDAMRHSFASYHLAKHRNENHTAQESGNSSQAIYSHYRELVRPDDVEACFGIYRATWPRLLRNASVEDLLLHFQLL